MAEPKCSCHLSNAYLAPSAEWLCYIILMIGVFDIAEICMLSNSRRVASVRAETICNLFSLTVEHFQSVLDRYPLMRRTMEGVAAERLTNLLVNDTDDEKQEKQMTRLKEI